MKTKSAKPVVEGTKPIQPEEESEGELEELIRGQSRLIDHSSEESAGSSSRYSDYSDSPDATRDGTSSTDPIDSQSLPEYTDTSSMASNSRKREPFDPNLKPRKIRIRVYQPFKNKITSIELKEAGKHRKKKLKEKKAREEKKAARKSKSKKSKESLSSMSETDTAKKLYKSKSEDQISMAVLRSDPNIQISKVSSEQVKDNPFLS